MAPSQLEASMIAEIIAGVNKKIREENGDISDFENEPELPTNRGNKLKRKSAYAHEGRLYGKRAYRKKITHAGYDRYILNRNPKRYDLDGYELDSEEVDEEADEDAADRNPYNGVDVQGLLMPLTATSDLWRHPGMSQAYTSEILPEMVRKANEMLRREKSTLYLVKELATKFRGDHTFIPCGDFNLDGDKTLFDVETIIKGLRMQVPNDEASQTPEAAIEVNVVSADPEDGIQGTKETQPEDAPMIMRDTVAGLREDRAAAAASSTADTSGGDPEVGPTNGVRTSSRPPEDTEVRQGAYADQSKDENDNSNHNASSNGEGDGDRKGEDKDEMEEDTPVPRMVTRGAAAAANGNGNAASQAGDEADKSARSQSPPASLPPVHPLFIPPTSSMPDRDLGLPPQEAEDTRKLLNVFIQKQEEVVRGCERMYEAFLKAERLRNTVYRWSRAEGHVGEMSDGEEWVDQEEWGLDEPLRKGAAEGEEETTREEERRGKGRRRAAA